MSAEVVLVIGQLHQGGAEGQLVALALGLGGSPYRPVVACLSEVSEPHASRLAAGGVAVEIFPRRRSGDPARLRALARFVASRRPAVVHSWLVGANAYAYGAARLAGISTFVASSRTSMRMPGTARRLVHGWVFRHADAVIANSDEVGRFTCGYYGVRPSRLHVVRNGLDLRPFAEAEGESSRLRGELGGGEGRLLVGTLGRLSREKNVDLFIAAAERLGAEVPEARFVIVGDGPERGRLETVARAALPGGRILFTGARSDVPGLLGALDLFVMTSETEGLPNAVMEAMAARLPVVATRVGGTREVVEEDVTGVTVEAGDLEGLVGSVRELLGDAPRRRRLGAAGRERIASEFSMERMVESTRGVYDAVRSGREGRGGPSR